MQDKIRIGLFAAVCCLASTAGAGDVNMNPGLWEWTAKITMPNSEVKIPESVNRKCLTRKDMVPATKKPGQECDIKELKTNSDQVSWAMTCKSPQGPVASTGKMFYQGDTAHGEVEVNTQGMLMTSKMTGRRLGECKK